VHVTVLRFFHPGDNGLYLVVNRTQVSTPTSSIRRLLITLRPKILPRPILINYRTARHHRRHRMRFQAALRRQKALSFLVEWCFLYRLREGVRADDPGALRRDSAGYFVGGRRELDAVGVGAVVFQVGGGEDGSLEKVIF
jgi:hypothetical protein